MISDDIQAVIWTAEAQKERVKFRTLIAKFFTVHLLQIWVQNIVVEIQQYQETWLQLLERTDTKRCTNTHYIINKKGGEI